MKGTLAFAAVLSVVFQPLSLDKKIQIDEAPSEVNSAVPWGESKTQFNPSSNSKPCRFLGNQDNAFLASLRAELITRMAANVYGNQILSDVQTPGGDYNLPAMSFADDLSGDYLAAYSRKTKAIEFNAWAIQTSIFPKSKTCVTPSDPSPGAPLLLRPLPPLPGDPWGIAHKTTPITFKDKNEELYDLQQQEFKKLLASPQTAKDLAIKLAPAFFHELTHSRQFRWFKSLDDWKTPTEFEIEALLKEIAFMQEEIKKDKTFYLNHLKDPIISFQVAKAKGAVTRSLDSVKTDVHNFYSDKGYVSMAYLLETSSSGGEWRKTMPDYYHDFFLLWKTQWPQLCASFSPLLSKFLDTSVPSKQLQPKPEKLKTAEEKIQKILPSEN